MCETLSLVRSKRITTTAREGEPISQRWQRIFLSNFLLVCVHLGGQVLIHYNHSSGYTQEEMNQLRSHRNSLYAPLPPHRFFSQNCALGSGRGLLSTGFEGWEWKRRLGALPPSSFPCSQAPHTSVGSILRFGPVQMGSEDQNSHLSSRHHHGMGFWKSLFLSSSLFPI